MTDETTPRPTLRSIMCETLHDYHLTNMRVLGTDESLSLVELLSNDADEGEVATVETGEQEVDLIAEQLAIDIARRASDSPCRRIVDVLGVDTGKDAALNLEGAIDSLLIAHGLSEDDTIVRTLRRVLGQVEETARLAQIGTAGAIAD